MPRHRSVALATVALLSGCAAVRAAPAVRTFRLDYPPPAPAVAAPLPFTVRVAPFGIAAAADHPGFTYREGASETGVDYYNRWIDNPARLIADLIARDLAASHRVQAVLQAPSALPIDYEINGQIEALEEQDEVNGCVAHLRLRIIVVRAPLEGRRRVLLQASFTADETCTRGAPESYAQATSRAVQRVSEQVGDAVVTAIANDALGERRGGEP